AVAWERTGATLSAPFAGVHIVEATKQVYRAIPARRERRRFVPTLQPVLAPSPGAAARSSLERTRASPVLIAPATSASSVPPARRRPVHRGRRGVRARARR